MSTGGVMKSAIRLVVGMVLTIAATHAIAAVPNSELQSVLSKLKASSTPDQYQMFEQAIDASPALTEQLNDVAASGQLTAIVIGEKSALPRTGSPFSAYVYETTWAFTPEFIQQQSKTRYMDVVMPGDLLGNNMVFALGELAYNTKSAPQVAASEQTLNDQMRQAIKQSQGHFDATDFLKQSMKLHIGNTVLGFIQGWNDMLDAAVKENSGQPLTLRQLVSLTENFRYRAVFMRAMRSPHPLQYQNNGRIEPTDANRDAMIEALKTMPLYDLQ
jgi:hypothetical protein